MQLGTIMNQLNSLLFHITYLPQISFHIALQILPTFPTATFTKCYPNQISYVFTAFTSKNSHLAHSHVIYTCMSIIRIPYISQLISVAVI
jgi:hypothetical protein